mmetsp:Transcript_6320/g.10958  ORF Transcript_6320/g.10958 Transcript_6320/m.10958 type:complete len:150 (+) Transcript_6320:1-450(+)
MNWTDSVLGTCLMDFFAHNEHRCMLLDECIAMWPQLYKDVGWHETLRCPPPENPFNLTYSIELQHYRRWAKHWFGIARRTGACSVGNVEYVWPPSPLSNTGSSTVSYTWTYDADVNLMGVEPGAGYEETAAIKAHREKRAQQLRDINGL